MESKHRIRCVDVRLEIVVFFGKQTNSNAIEMRTKRR